MNRTLEFLDMFFALVWRRPDDRCKWWQVISIRTAFGIAWNWAKGCERRPRPTPEPVVFSVTPEDLPRLEAKILAVRSGNYRIEIEKGQQP